MRPDVKHGSKVRRSSAERSLQVWIVDGTGRNRNEQRAGLHEPKGRGVDHARRVLVSRSRDGHDDDVSFSKEPIVVGRQPLEGGWGRDEWAVTLRRYYGRADSCGHLRDALPDAPIAQLRNVKSDQREGERRHSQGTP